VAERLKKLIVGFIPYFSIMPEGFDIWKLLAGLGIFLFGMFLMEESIKKLSGRSFKRLIREYTTGKIKSIFAGIFATSILQSSSAVSLMILAFVGAGIMTMENAIGVILGSNIGTTITAWIVATLGFKFSIESFALPMIGSGGLGLIFLGNSEKYANISKLVVGFGFLFMGLDYMKTSMEVFTGTLDIKSIPDYGIIFYLVIGILLTAIMQSSSATIAIVLTALNLEILGFNTAAAMVIGANVGTTATILLGAIGAIQVKKRVAFSHLVFNLVTALVALLLMPALIYVVIHIVDIKNDAVIGLALFHTFFNLLGVLIFFPFIPVLARVLTKIFPDKKTEVTLFINNTTPEIAEAAISAMKMETLHLVRNALHFNLSVLRIDEKLVFSQYDYSGTETKPIRISEEDMYDNLKLLQAEIFTFSAGIQSHELSETESQTLNRYQHGARLALHSAKTIKDVKHNFDEFENSDSNFLNEQYTHFRKRMIETYLKIDKLIMEDTKKDKTKTILKILKNLKEEDHDFLRLTTQAINSKQLQDIEVSTAILVNRAFLQSCKQILFAILELVLSKEETQQFEVVQDINEEVGENP
jgi:phosphate:Na+ symporter